MKYNPVQLKTRISALSHGRSQYVQEKPLCLVVVLLFNNF